MIAEQVAEIIIKQLGVAAADVTPATSFKDDLGADSLDVIDLAMTCEETFGVEIPDDDIEQIVTVGDLVKYIGRRLDPAKTA